MPTLPAQLFCPEIEASTAALAALMDAGDDRVWAFHGLAPASFWARRMAHETVVHRADAQLAAGQDFTVGAPLAADAIDEWLTVLTAPAPGEPDERGGALPPGRSLHIHATDHGLDGAGEWLAGNAADGVTVTSGHGRADVALSGPAADLLLVLMRRKPASDPAVRVFGDQAVLDQWLEHTPF